jgi:aspartyl/asparaginyl-tRNA synthetase
MSFFSRTDEAIEAYKDQIQFLKDMVKNLEQQREAERVEYKRAIDVLLHEKQMPIVGQYTAPPSNTVPPLPVDLTKAFAFMEEEVPQEKK